MQGIVSDFTHCCFKVAKVQEVWILHSLPLGIQVEQCPFRIFWVEPELGKRDLKSLVVLCKTGNDSEQVHIVCPDTVNDLGLVWLTTKGSPLTEATYDFFDFLFLQFCEGHA
jgi:hypothetical protein